MNQIKVGQKLQSLYFNGRLFIHSILGLPAQTAKEIKLLKTIFNNICDNKKVKIFEWGSGFSTIYYGNYLRKKGVQFEWHSIDNNKKWHEKVRVMIRRKNLEPHVRLYLKDFIPFWEKPGWGPIPPACRVFGPKSENEVAYVNFPKQFDERFNIVIIDARFRRHCIQTTKEVLLSKGIAIMHDAQKQHYQVGLSEFKFNLLLDSGAWYPFQRMPNKIWVGSIENKDVFDILKSL